MKRIVFFFLTLLVLFSCNQQNAWKEAKNRHTIEAYENYLNDFPKGKFVDEAKSSIEEINFIKADSIGTINSYENFLKKYPSGIYSDSAKLQIEKIKFLQADSIYTINAFSEFLKNYPASKYADSAKARIESIEYKNTYKEYSVTAFNDFLKKYPNSIYKKQIEDELKSGRLPKYFKTAFGSISISLKNSTELRFKINIKNHDAFCQSSGSMIREFFTVKPENKAYYYDVTEGMRNLYGRGYNLSEFPSIWEPTIKIKPDEKKFVIKICNDVIKYEI